MKFNTTARHLAIGLVLATTGASALAGELAGGLVARCNFSPVRATAPGDLNYQKFMATQNTGTADCPSFAGATSFHLFVSDEFKGPGNINDILNPEGFPSGHNYAGVPNTNTSNNSFSVEVLMRSTRISQLQYYKRYVSNAIAPITFSDKQKPDLDTIRDIPDLQGTLPKPSSTQALKVIFSAPRGRSNGTNYFYSFANSHFEFRK